MKRLFTLLLTCWAIASFVIAQDLERFRVDGPVTYYSAWLEVQNAQLDIQIPPAQVIKRWGAEPEGGVTLRDFTLVVRPSTNNNKSVILLSAPDGLGKTHRNTTTSLEDLEDWTAEVLPFGYTPDDFLTNDEAKALMEQ